jgi:hypothetical protein
MAINQSSNGNRAVAEKNGTNTWQIVIMAGAVILTLISQFWSLANPREDIKTVRSDLQISIDRQEKDLHDLIEKDQRQVDMLTKSMDERVQARAKETDEQIQAIQHYLQTDVVGLREHVEFVKRQDMRLALLEQITAKHQDSIVTRAEHQGHWADIDQKFTVLNGRLDALINQFTGTFTVGDQLKNLQKEIDDLRILQTGMHAAAIGSPIVVPVAPSH